MSTGDSTLTTTATNGIGQTYTIEPFTQWYWPSYWNAPYYVTQPYAPGASCFCHAHVFACDHARTCKCGQVIRANPKPVDE